MWPQREKIEILDQWLSPTTQNHYADLEDTCDSQKFGVVRYTKKSSEKKKTKAGGKFDPGWSFEG